MKETHSCLFCGRAVNEENFGEKIVWYDKDGVFCKICSDRKKKYGDKMIEDKEIDIPCNKCGGKEFIFEEENGETIFNCVNCGHRFSLGLRVDYEDGNEVI